MTALWVTAGAAVGAVIRYLVGVRFNSPGSLLPWGTWAVNVVGSLIAGVVYGWSTSPLVGAGVLLGFCGALTTYSAFAVDTWQLIGSGALRRAVLNVAANLIIGLAALDGGFLLAQLA